MMPRAKDRRHGNRYSYPQMTAREANTLGSCYYRINKVLQAQQKRGVFYVRTHELEKVLDILKHNAFKQDRFEDFRS